ncbi:cystinosin-like [Centruroides sculpturatus]|uniref:cystinosin-like n=1 Tax=Centruroides sculpturatus TaxID=218467 RepID=UPI000C6D5361|nr:cystinosin-like [Centruroides sculpturatus]
MLRKQTYIMDKLMKFIILFSSCLITTESLSIEVSTNDLEFQLSKSGEFSVYPSEMSNQTIYVGFIYEDENILKVLSNDSVIPPETNERLNFTVLATEAGHSTLVVNATPSNVRTDNAFIRVKVFKIPSLKVISAVVGWIYFVAWSISFYPQIYTNWKRKSVVGLNFDFLAFNITGYLAYSIFNVGLYFIPEIQKEYHSWHPTGVIPVEPNDVGFALHALLATLIQIIQCFIYDHGDQKLSHVAIGLISAGWSAASVFLLVTSLGVIKETPWLNFLLFFSYLKLGVTVSKYIPQAYFNYKRKSTEGWSIGNILLDFTGGVLSILQMFLIAYNFDDWTSIFGNFTKFGLGMISILFDILFMIQHYCLYREKDEMLLDADNSLP